MPLVPTNTALIVIDVQCGWYVTTPAPHDAGGTLERINDLIDRTRASGGTVIFIQHAEEPDYTPRTAGWELHPGLHRQPADLIIAKSVCDSFYRTELAAALQARRIETLVVCGAATDFCVDTTIRAAASLGYRVVVPSDAHATKDRPALSASAVIAHHNWVWSELSAPHPVVVAPTAAIRFP